MINIAIIDDNIDSCNLMERIICGMEDSSAKHIINNPFIDVDIFRSGAELIRHLDAEPKTYHIYLLDIQMPEPNGIEAAAFIRKMDLDAVIIFITDYKEYVYDVFEVLPFRFLKKPVSAEQLSGTIDDAISHIRSFGQIFFFQIGHEKYQLHYREILFFEGRGRKVTIHTKNNTYDIYDRIANILERIDSALFCRIHTSYLVNMDYIRSIKKQEVTLEDGTPLPISKSFLQTVKQSHLTFMERRC